MANKWIFILSSIIPALLTTGCVNERTVSPIKMDVIDVVFASGYLVKESQYMVIANTEGFINESMVNEGDSVHIGDGLFRLSNQVQSVQLDNARSSYRDALNKVDPNSPQLKQLELQIDQAEVQLRLDSTNFERYQDLVRTNAVSRSDFDKVKAQYEKSMANVAILKKSLSDLKRSLQLNLKNAKDQLEIQRENNEDYFIRSRIRGVVQHVYKEHGELVKRGEQIAEIGGGADLVKLFVAEEDISNIAVGQKARIALNTEKVYRFDAQITKIYPAFDESEQSFVVEARFLNRPETLFTGTQLQANIVIAEKKGALVIPNDYLLRDDKVILEDNGDTLSIEIGLRTSEWAEVLNGLDLHTVIRAPKNTME